MKEVKKDSLYYNDLIYKIKSLSGLIEEPDELVEKRISKREELTGVITEIGIVYYIHSIFQLEVFKIVRTISKKVNVPFKSLYEISKYKKEVEEVISFLEKEIYINNNTKKYSLVRKKN